MFKFLISFVSPRGAEAPSGITFYWISAKISSPQVFQQFYRNLVGKMDSKDAPALHEAVSLTFTSFRSPDPDEKSQFLQSKKWTSAIVCLAESSIYWSIDLLVYWSIGIFVQWVYWSNWSDWSYYGSMGLLVLWVYKFMCLLFYWSIGLMGLMVYWSIGLMGLSFASCSLYRSIGLLVQWVQWVQWVYGSIGLIMGLLIYWSYGSISLLVLLILWVYLSLLVLYIVYKKNLILNFFFSIF